MASLLSRLGLRKQIGLLGLLGALGVAAIGGVFVIGTAQQAAFEAFSEHADRLERGATGIETGFLQARRAEKDFLLRADEALVARHGEVMQGLLRTVGEARARAVARPETAELATGLDEVRVGVERYGERFAAIVSTRRKLGLDERSGLQGALRQSVQAIETRLQGVDEPRLTVLMLMMRRHEKDFIMRGEARYRDEFERRVAEFGAALAGSSVPAAARREMTDLLAAYRRDFLAFVEARLAQDTEQKALSDGYRVVEAALATTKGAVLRKQAEAAALRDARNAAIALVMWSVLGLGLAVVVSGSVAIGLAIARPISAMTGVMRRLADGDTGVDVPGSGRADEIGAMAAALAIFRENAVAAARLEAEQAAERDAKERRARRLDALMGTFEARVHGLVGHLSAAASEMEATANAMSATAAETNRQSGSADEAARRSAGNVQMVATATEELAASALEVGQQVGHSARIARGAVDQVRRTDETVRALAQGAQRIGDVVRLISDIAGQTNLLALNATIEAARAGEAGRGFAVVAAEVKILADQTGRATDEISNQIAGIQAATESAVSAMQTIGSVIEEVSRIATAISAAVEEQQAATQDIARNVAEAARGGEVMTGTIGEVRQAAAQTGAAASQVLASANELARNSADLRGEVDRFLGDVKAA